MSELRSIGIIFSELMFLTLQKSVVFRLYYENMRVFDLTLFFQAASSLPLPYFRISEPPSQHARGSVSVTAVLEYATQPPPESLV